MLRPRPGVVRRAPGAVTSRAGVSRPGKCYRAGVLRPFAIAGLALIGACVLRPIDIEGKPCGPGLVPTPSRTACVPADGGAAGDVCAQPFDLGGSVIPAGEERFEGGVGGWLPYQVELAASAESCLGTGSLRLCTARLDDGAIFQRSLGEAPPGRTYEAVAWVRTDDVRQATVALALVDLAMNRNDTLAIAKSTPAAPASGWHRLSTRLVIPTTLPTGLLECQLLIGIDRGPLAAKECFLLDQVFVGAP